jgi:hypothetical protein
MLRSRHPSRLSVRSSRSFAGAAIARKGRSFRSAASNRARHAGERLRVQVKASRKSSEKDVCDAVERTRFSLTRHSRFSEGRPLARKPAHRSRTRCMRSGPDTSRASMRVTGEGALAARGVQDGGEAIRPIGRAGTSAALVCPRWGAARRSRQVSFPLEVAGRMPGAWLGTTTWPCVPPSPS